MTVYEANDAQVIAQWAQQWSDVVSFEIYAAVDDAGQSVAHEQVKMNAHCSAVFLKSEGFSTVQSFDLFSSGIFPLHRKLRRTNGVNP